LVEVVIELAVFKVFVLPDRYKKEILILANDPQCKRMKKRRQVSRQRGKRKDRIK
jgi:hypothetical protein